MHPQQLWFRIRWWWKVSHIVVDSHDKRSERGVILRISGRKPTPKWGFCAMAAAVVIGFRYACGYEYTGVLRTYHRKIPARKSPAQAISPKKLSKRLPRGQKKTGKNLFSCFLVILLSCYFYSVLPEAPGGTGNRSKREHPGVLADLIWWS